jgi:hypothetical protein
MTDEGIPGIEWAPPYSPDFVAHLHGGCYPADVTPALLYAVNADPEGQRVLDALTVVQLELLLAELSE